MTLTEWELTSQRQAIEELLPNTCSIMTLSTTSDSMGEFTQVWVETDEVKCRVDAKVKGEGLVAGGIQAYERYTLTLAHGTTITGANRVKIGSTQYNIIAINLSPSWALDLRIEVQPVLT